MSAHHLTVDVLSAYLDRELAENEAADVARHLDGCESCQEQLEGLRSVAFGLRETPRLTPPPLMEQAVRRQIQLVDRRLPAWKQPRLAGRLNSNLLLLFAMVIALAVVVGLFGEALERLEQNGPRIVAPAGGSLADAAPPETAQQRVEGRLFELQGGIWRENGAVAPSRTLEATEVEALLQSRPGLSQLRGGDVWLLWPEADRGGAEAPADQAPTVRIAAEDLDAAAADPDPARDPDLDPDRDSDRD
ncbi:MAG: hypothetical protein DWQ36_09495 [Acidobacteria bacterium]|nr:MAG: hypothetical protein DWQ30_04880 [Acidobacteriota bacterium]REK08589.1 MAG: hypothetical protein DWQ36_09495 [Acidobacteriota bacterium]